ncbi:MAG: SDR family NAD(P)-dependent oxidoreductase [Eubacteriales bacterium]|nr:SDR family NAD(P)-dependent oxidoreductase [Eubacteriales bacterium]
MRTVLFTGATGSIGGAAARQCLAGGDQLICVARDPAKAQSLAKAGAEIHIADLADPKALRALTESLASDPPDAAVLAAGTYFLRERRVVRYEGAETEKEIHLAVNAVAPLRLAEALARSGVARIVFVSSIAARWVRCRGTDVASLGKTKRYAMTKRALEAGMQELARRYPATVFVRVHPGVSATGLFTQPGSAFPRFLLPAMRCLFPSPAHAARGIALALTADETVRAVHPRFFIGGKPVPCRCVDSSDALPLVSDVLGPAPET